MPCVLFVKNLAATWAAWKSDFIMSSEMGILRGFLTSDDHVISDKHLGDEG